MTTPIIGSDMNYGKAVSQMTKNAKEDVENTFSQLMQSGAELDMELTPNEGVAKGSNSHSAYEASASEANAKRQQLDDKQTSSVKTEDKTSASEKVSEDTKQVAGKETDKVQMDQKSDDEEMILSEEIKKILEDLAQKLGISDEDLEDAMEVLDLSVMDLMQQGNMAMLVASVEDVPQTDILVDEGLAQLVSDMAGMVVQDLEALADELGLDMESFEKKLADALTNGDANADGEVAEMGSALDAMTNQNAVADKNESVLEKLPADDTAKITSDKAEKNDATLETDGSAELDQNTQNVEGVKAENADAHSDKKDENDSNKGSEQTNVVQINQYDATQDVIQIQDAGVEEYTSVKTQDIIQQIVTQAKVSITEDMSSMEMQLNPANLGNIHLQVEAKNGQITAQLTASDDAVRAALESQIVELKEAMEAQGMKVTAIEVTAGGHALEQNLDQSGEQAADEAQQMAAKKNARRILNLDEVVDENGELTTELDSAEQLQVEMMRMGGNKLNFRV